MLRKFPVLLVAILAVSVFSGRSARAQSGSTWLGFELGSPTGIVIMFDRGAQPDLELLAAWAIGDRFFLNGHMLWLANESADPPLSLKYGPGVFVGFRDRDPGSDDMTIGASFRLEGTYHWDQFQVYLALTPRLEIIEETEGFMGGGLGFRMRL